MASSRTTWAEDMCERWEREAFGLERLADLRDADYTAVDRKLMHMHARIKRACAQELRLESRRLRRG